MSNKIISNLYRLYRATFGKEAQSVQPLSGDGSDRLIFRIFGGESSVIAVFGRNQAENDAFEAFSRHFELYSLPVPHIFAYNRKEGLYLESDFGDVMLYDCMVSPDASLNQDVRRLYKQAVAILPEFQIKAGRSLDYSKCCQTTEFDSEAMLRDLLYFQWAFLRRFASNYCHSKLLYDDFAALIRTLLDEPAEFFLYRDFQSRNIMVLHDQLYFIDYQSGRKGALQYDLASLLFDANVRLGQNLREELIDEYLCAVNRYLSMPSGLFMRRFYDFALIRVLQALAAFSFLGFDKSKPYFRSCIPRGVEILQELLMKSSAGRKMKLLPKIFEEIETSLPDLEGKRLWFSQ